MKLAIKIIVGFFTVLGVIFTLLLAVALYLWLADPFKIKPLLFPNNTNNKAEQSAAPTADRNPLLSADQEAALDKIGVDPAKLPSKITPEMQACFTQKLGAARVAEIIKSGSPTVAEYFIARDCLN